MEKIIIEVGSTVTKVDKVTEDKIERVEDITILFKKNYSLNNKILDSDLNTLISVINKYREGNELYVCGTSIFRTLSDDAKKEVFDIIKSETGQDFNIISQDEEGELTVLGTTRFVKDKVCVFIGGGGSTEIAMYDNKIISNTNTSIGVVDVMKKFPDLENDIATTPLEEVMDYIRGNLNVPNDTADILILAGGGHEYFARNSGVNYEDNTLYSDASSTIMMDIDTRIRETKRYYTEISLDEIRSRVSDPDWWFATRAMCAFVLVVAEKINAKYIVPTNIGMAYGILASNNN